MTTEHQMRKEGGNMFLNMNLERCNVRERIQNNSGFCTSWMVCVSPVILQTLWEVAGAPLVICPGDQWVKHRYLYSKYFTAREYVLLKWAASSSFYADMYIAFHLLVNTVDILQKHVMLISTEKQWSRSPSILNML